MAGEQKRLADAVATAMGKLKSTIIYSASAMEFPPLTANAPTQLPTDTQSSDNGSNTPSPGTWSNMAMNLAASGGVTVSPSRETTDAGRRIVLRGSNTVASKHKLKIVPRRLTAFVGRLHIDTTEEDLTDFLRTAGIVNPKCKKLDPKGRTFSTSAFMVSCDDCCREIFYNEDTWPSGCELRDWVFYNKRP